MLVTTKAPLVERDLDLLSALASHGAASATVTLPFLDPARARALEPWVASPSGGSRPSRGSPRRASPWA